MMESPQEKEGNSIFVKGKAKQVSHLTKPINANVLLTLSLLGKTKYIPS